MCTASGFFRLLTVRCLLDATSAILSLSQVGSFQHDGRATTRYGIYIGAFAHMSGHPAGYEERWEHYDPVVENARNRQAGYLRERVAVVHFDHRHPLWASVKIAVDRARATAFR